MAKKARRRTRRRGPSDVGRRYDKVICFRVTSQELRTALTASKASGLPLSGWARAVVVDAAKKGRTVRQVVRRRRATAWQT